MLGRARLPHLIARHGDRRNCCTRSPRTRYERTRSARRAQPRSGLVRAESGHASDGISAAERIYTVDHSRSRRIRFGISLEESRCVNVVGTENLLRFAAQCSRLDRFAYISTVYVWGGKSGRIREEAAQPGRFLNPYQQAKFEAEQVTLAAMSAIPAATFIASAPWFTTARLNG